MTTMTQFSFTPALPGHGIAGRLAAIARRAGFMLLLASLAVMAGACKPKADSPATKEGEGVKEGETKSGEVMVFAAASLRETLQELGASFEKETGTKVVFNFAGSNELARQITASPTADLFLSASESWMDSVEKAGRVVTGTRRDLLSNTLVVIGNASSKWTMDGPCALAKIPFKHLALGDPKAVPAGQYANKWLTSVQCDGKTAWDGVQERVAPAPDVRAAVGQVVADPSMVGIVYKSDWMAFSDKTRVLYEVKDGPPIRYVLAQIAQGKNPDGAKKFYDYMARAESGAVYQKHGFGTIDAKAPATP